MKIIRNKFLPPKGYSAIMLFGIIFIRSETQLTPRTIRHEEIHKKQMIGMPVLFFYLWYGVEYLIRWIMYGNLKKAYRNISFEREAYDNDHITDYKRSPFSWIRYLNKESINSINIQ